MQTNFTYNKKNYIINTDYPNDHIFKVIKSSNNFYEIKLLEKIKSLGLDGVAIDIGSNIGNHTLYFANECNFSNVEGFELSDKIFNILVKNILNNKINNVNYHNIGLSDKEKFVNISNIDVNNIGMTHITEGDSIKLQTLDNIYLNYNKKINLIKIDTEGCEYDILIGGLLTIKKHKPVLVIEILNEEIFNKINNLLITLGYSTDKITYTHTPTYIWKIKQ